jgi:hypothetical protein
MKNCVNKVGSATLPTTPNIYRIEMKFLIQFSVGFESRKTNDPQEKKRKKDQYFEELQYSPGA